MDLTSEGGSEEREAEGIRIVWGCVRGEVGVQEILELLEDRLGKLIYTRS